MKLAAKIALAVSLLLVASQLVTFERTNPPTTSLVHAPADVEQVLRRACFDCHSNETTWPWYSRVAPVSWLVHRDVVEGRKHLNFSTWRDLAPERRARKQKGAGKEVHGGDMPPWFYLPMHPEAKLTDAERALIEQWASGPTSE